jgi:RNA polymerase sigma-70 factor, ECF subfamily
MSESPSPTEPGDGELVQRSRRGDRTAFDGLIVRHGRQAMAVSMRLLGNASDASEVVQDAYLKAYQSLESLERPEAFAGWLMRIVSNLSLNKRRSRGLRKAQSYDLAVPGSAEGGTDIAGESLREGETDPLRSIMGHELGAKLQQALQQLPERQRLAIVMFTIEEMPQKQVAEALDCSVEAVKWHVFQGRKRLRELLQEYL